MKEIEDIYLPRPATLLLSHPMTEEERFFRFQWDAPPYPSYLPGQFMSVSVPGIGEAPISITSAPSQGDEKTFEMVIRNVGNVTDALHRLKEGARVGIRGPFGTHFPVEEEMKKRDLLFVCGGLGLVPVRSAIHYVLEHRDQYGAVTILFGARRPTNRLFIDDLFDWKTRDDVTCLETVDMADPSWGGNVGVITSLFPRVQLDGANTIAIVCGPPIMYKFVLRELLHKQIPLDQIFVSLERHMKCGVGKCGHCQINGIYACQTGPVYKYEKILHLKEAI